MKRLLTLLLLCCCTPAQAEVTRHVASGALRFERVGEERGEPQQVIKLAGKIDLVFNLSVLSDGKGHEYIDGLSKPTNETDAKLHYAAYVALFDEKKSLVATLHSDDLFAHGVQRGENFTFSMRAILPAGRSRDIRSYQAVLFVSTEPLQ
ncbi:MAG TPA: hypothetical protein VF033_12235 [Steroidobacteraceae bacterium]